MMPAQERVIKVVKMPQVTSGKSLQFDHSGRGSNMAADFCQQCTTQYPRPGHQCDTTASPCLSSVQNPTPGIDISAVNSRGVLF